ncbi:PhzF family phenazine biosynthesis protein [Rubritalea sp.]|uniref:PhzF family phenazine biosynthesis protein n=1 Tax=Rubritalea sp. TaxID=2109375 RepID=UPI003EF50357
MKLPIYQIDAFAEKTFEGNPAAVCPLQYWLPDSTMQAIAEENNLAETAFFVKNQGVYELRWFTPLKEVDLCGHATLASAFVLFQTTESGSDQVKFLSRSGELSVTRQHELLTLNFPIQPATQCEIDDDLVKALGMTPKALYRNIDYMAVFDTEEDVRSIQPDLSLIATLDCRCVIVTAPGRETDFVSRVFAPSVGIDEDPVTGSVHCSLTPFWAQELGRNPLSARQLSKRGGYLTCQLDGSRVLISGKAVSYLEGVIDIDDAGTATCPSIF